MRFPPAGGGEQRTALLGTIQVGSRPVTVAAGHLSNRQGHNVRQLRELQGLTGSRAAPRLLVGDLNLPSAVLLLASRRGWPETGRGRTWPNSAPTQQLDHILRNDPAGDPAPQRQGGRRPGQRPPCPGGRVRHRSDLTRPRTTRSVAWCSASVWSAPDGNGLLTLEASSIQTDPDGARRIVWTIKRMIEPAATSPPAGQLGAQVGGQAAASPVGSTGYADRQAFRPPWSASAWKPSWRSCSATRALVCSRGQVQYRTKGWSRRRSAAHSAT
jgi:hypothetical protein